MAETLEPTIGQMKDYLRPEQNIKAPKVEKRSKMIGKKTLRRRLPE